jgi:hypothetical protein
LVGQAVSCHRGGVVGDALLRQQRWPVRDRRDQRMPGRGDPGPFPGGAFPGGVAVVRVDDAVGPGQFQGVGLLFQQ